MKKDLDGKLILMQSNLEKQINSLQTKTIIAFILMLITFTAMIYYTEELRIEQGRNILKARTKADMHLKAKTVRNYNMITDLNSNYSAADYSIDSLYQKHTSLKGLLNNLIAVQNDCQYVSNFLRFKEPVIVDVNDTNPMNLKLHCHLTRNDGSELIITAENARKSVINHKADLEFEEKRRKKRGRKKAK